MLVLLVLNVHNVDAQAEVAAKSAGQAATVCDINDGPNSFETEHFHINYDTVGGGLTIQEYGDVLEAAYALEVTSYGWAAPPLCTAAACDGNANPWGKYPVQVTEATPAGAVGYVTADGRYAGYYVGDNPNTAAVESFSLTTCMVLQADFEQFGPNPRQILEETVAHEFLHAIQEGYGDDPDAIEADMWYESSAVYIEDEFVDDSVNDHQYLWPRVDNCLADWPSRSAPSELSEYSNFLLLRYAAEQAGGTHVAGGGEDLIQTMWENISAQQPALTAFGNALQSKNLALPSFFHEYAIGLKFSRSCGGGYVAPYCLSEGDSYRATAFEEIETHGALVAASANTFSGAIKDDFAVNWIELPISSRFSLTLQNQSAGGSLQASVACDTGSEIQVEPFPNASISGDGQSQLAEIDTNGCVDAVVAITNHAQSGDGNLCTERSYQLTRALISEPEPQPNSQTAYFPIAIVSP